MVGLGRWAGRCSSKQFDISVSMYVLLGGHISDSVPSHTILDISVAKMMIRVQVEDQRLRNTSDFILEEFLSPVGTDKYPRLFTFPGCNIIHRYLGNTVQISNVTKIMA